MSRLQEFLMKEEAVAAVGPVRAEVPIKGLPFPALVQSITEAENKAIRKSCQKVNFDKKTHQRDVETDQDLYNTRLVAECCQDPNFKDAALQKKFGVMGAEALINKLLKPGQFVDLLVGVQDVCGFADEDINDLRDEAKN